MEVCIACYSLYDHVHAMAQAMAKGVREAGPDADAELSRLPEMLPADVIENTGAAAFQKEFASPGRRPAAARYQGGYGALVTRELGKAKDAILRNKDMREKNACMRTERESIAILRF
jgi:hypothetical protein